jgi:3-oxoacyl-[acyl-carrier protein] reductase
LSVDDRNGQRPEEKYMEMGLRGTVALVTAASQGLGKAIATELAKEGAGVVICARRADVLEDTANEIRGLSGSKVVAIAADVSTPEGVEAAVGAAIESFGRLDILVNNAGGPPPGDFTKHDDAAWQRAFEQNLLSAVRLVRAALPHLKESGRGRIINMTGTAVKEPVEGLILSNSIRSAVIGMAKTLSSEFAAYNITVNNIAPGRIATERVEKLDQARAEASGSTAAEVKRGWEAQIPMGRYGRPEELAYLAVFLASDKASYITGTTIQVDGGMVKGMY